jgi:NTP pyrophosphatase (non-canonical NTP hydrolase)
MVNGLNNAANDIYRDNVVKGHWQDNRQIGTLLMLCVSELSEAMEADRKNKYVDKTIYKKAEGFSSSMLAEDRSKYLKGVFENTIKDTFEDEMADTVIRILDICGKMKIDIEWHIVKKLEYNKLRFEEKKY